MARDKSLDITSLVNALSAARTLGISETRIRSLADSGELP